MEGKRGKMERESREEMEGGDAELVSLLIASINVIHKKQ